MLTFVEHQSIRNKAQAEKARQAEIQAQENQQQQQQLQQPTIVPQIVPQTQQN